MSNSTLDLPKTKTQLSNDLQMTTLLTKSLQTVIKAEKELNSGQNALEVTFDKVRQLEEDFSQDNWSVTACLADLHGEQQLEDILSTAAQ